MDRREFLTITAAALTAPLVGLERLGKVPAPPYKRMAQIVDQAHSDFPYVSQYLYPFKRFEDLKVGEIFRILEPDGVPVSTKPTEKEKEAAADMASFHGLDSATELKQRMDDGFEFFKVIDTPYICKEGAEPLWGVVVEPWMVSQRVHYHLEGIGNFDLDLNFQVVGQDHEKREA